MKRTFALLLALTMLLCCGCAVRSSSREEQENCLRLYCPSELSEVPGGDAIGYVNVNWEELPAGDPVETAQAILQLLLGECADENFKSPLPVGTKLQKCERKGSVLLVDFSAAYGQLNGIQLTMADYCVALSLTQISGIHAVRITVNGQELAYRDTNLLLASDVLLTSTEDVVRTLSVMLYFPEESGELAAEERLLSVYEGESRLEAVVDALAAGPEDSSYQALLPEGFAVQSIWADGETCCVSLLSEVAELLPPERAKQQLIVQGLVNSLCSMENVSQVQFLLDGEPAETLGQIDISQPILPKT